MPLGEFDRQVLLFNLHLEMVPEEADAFVKMDVPGAVALLQEIYAAGKAVLKVGEYAGDPDGGEEDATDAAGNNVILIRELSVDPDGNAMILLHHGDAGAADPALMKISDGTVRTAGKAEDEVVAYAAHLIISTSKYAKNGQCRALLERVPNLGRGTVMAFLNRLLREHAAAVNLRYKDETKREKRCHPKLISQEQMSHRLKADLNDGKLSRIEFVTRHKVAGFEEQNRVVPMNQVLIHKVVNPPTGNAALDLLERAKAWGRKNNYEEMQIRFRGTIDRRSASPRFATTLQDAQDAVYSRLEQLTAFKEALEQCPRKIVPIVRTKMLALFSVAALWK